jgi:hypothetical protein
MVDRKDYEIQDEDPATNYDESTNDGSDGEGGSLFNQALLKAVKKMGRRRWKRDVSSSTRHRHLTGSNLNIERLE